MLDFKGPIHPSFYLAADAPVTAEASSVGTALRVMRSTGYPHDIKVVPGQTASLRAGRVFAPVVHPGAALRVDVADEARFDFKILCANCFTEMYATPLPTPVTLEGIAVAEDGFWTTPELRDRGCPKCFAAAAKPH